MNGIATKLRTLQKRISIKNNSDFSKNVSEQLRFFARLNKPKDDIERSFQQYKCQMFLLGRFLTFAYNVCSFPLCILFIIKTYKRNKPETEKECDAVFYMDDMDDSLVPMSIKKEFPQIIIKPKNNHSLLKSDIKYLAKIHIRHPLSWFFTFKNCVKVSMYNYLINSYQPKAILAFSEYSFTSSILTQYCREHGIEHIDIMHGEKLLSIRDAFFRYDRCYVWDEHYKELFCSIGAEQKQFIIERPASLVFDGFLHDLAQCSFDFTYYLQAETQQQLNTISKELLCLKNAGYKIAYRPHPSHVNEDIKSILSDYAFENPLDVSIKESLSRTRHAISRYSTVLYQAYNNNVSVVIDDITDPEFYENLCQEKYIMLDKPHELLSTYVRPLK